MVKNFALFALLATVAVAKRKKMTAGFSNMTFVLFVSSFAFCFLAYHAFRVVVDLVSALREVRDRQKRKAAAETRAKQRCEEEQNKPATKGSHRRKNKKETPAPTTKKVDGHASLKIYEKKLWIRFFSILVACYLFSQFGGMLGKYTQNTTFDPYEVLGVSETTPKAKIRKTYRHLAAKWHPDKNRGNPNAKAKFDKISKAAEILLNDKKRLKWQKGLSEWDGVDEMEDNVASWGLPKFLQNQKVEHLVIGGYASLFIVILPGGFFYLKDKFKNDKIYGEGKANEQSAGKFLSEDLQDMSSGHSD